jgi:hypothetical protein
VRRGWLLAAGGLVGAAILGWALLLRSGAEPTRAARAPRAGFGPSVETPSLREAVKALPAADKGVDRNEILALLREAAQAYRAKDASRFHEAFSKILKHGSAIQRLLAEFILETADADERLVAALALQEVATAEIAPFAMALVRSDLPDAIKAVAVDLLTKFRVAEAGALLESLLFKTAASQDLKRRMLGYFIEMGGVDVLARAAVEPSFAELRKVAAEGLAKVGTAAAANALLEAWKKTFVGKSDRALSNYYLLQALAGFDPALLRGIVRDFLKSETSVSARNVFLSMLGKADKGLAMETIKDLLANEKTVSIRQQAIYVLAAIGGAEAQEILLGILSGGAGAKELTDAANALLQQDRLEVAFDKVRQAYALARDPMMRSVLAGVLAKYEAELAADPTLVALLQKEAGEGMASRDPAVRGLSVTLSAQLARYGADPASSLIGLYDGLAPNEKAGLPVVFSELSKRNEDPRVRLILESALADESAPEPNRLIAADTLFASGGAEKVYGAIEGSKSPEMTSLLVGIALARGGQEAAGRLGRIAEGSADPAKKQAIGEQIKVWAGQE